MSVKSEWRLNELLLGEDDPFATVILSSGLHVDLTGTEEELFDGIKRALMIEARLFERGITCGLKDGGQDCLTCPEYVADRSEEKRAPLCRLGRDERIMEERYKALRLEPLIELAEIVEPYTELGHLPADYEVLLAAVGL